MSVIENPNECSHPGCPALGTHRVVIVLVTDDREPLAKKYPAAHLNGTPLRRCKAHQTTDPWAFITSDEVWNRYAVNFSRTGCTTLGYVPVAARARTSVHYIDDHVEIENIPVLVPTARGLEEAGKTQLIS